MFRSATVKLTTLYLLIIIAISLFFSVNLYNLAYNELERGLQRQTMDLQRAPRLRDILNDRLTPTYEQLEEGRQRILWRLFYANLGIALLGGVGCYFLARATLRPIEEAMEKQNRFTADASHELRTPLAAMQSEIEVALRSKKLTKAEAKKLLGSNLEEVAKLSSLASGLLSLANGKDTFVSREKIDISKVAKAAVESFKEAAKLKKVQISSSGSTAWVMADRQALTQVLNILIDNAIKYSKPGTSISVETNKAGKQAIISVADQGIGINQSNFAHIFERFYRADSSRSKNNTGGYGLGLSIAKQLVEQHKGTIGVKSAVNKGSTFSVKLPLVA